MLTINLSKPVVIYDNINEMPISRYSDFQRGLMIDANIGSTIQDFDKLFNQSVKFIDGKKYKEAMQFLLNVRTGIYLAQQGQSPTNYAFASLVKSIDGVRITDYSEDGLSKILEELDKLGLPQAKLNEVLEDVKKKSSMILEIRFPTLFDGTEELGFIQNIKAKYKAKTDFYKTNNAKLLERVRSANSNVLNYLKPKRIDSNSRESYNISSMVEFEKVCAGLQEQTPAIKVKDMTVMEFYSKIELLKEREKSMK